MPEEKIKWILRNPIITLLPVFVFVVLENILRDKPHGLDWACGVALTLNIFFIVYPYFFEKRKELDWHKSPYVLMIIFTTILLKLVDFKEFKPIAVESVMLIFSILGFVFRKRITGVMLTVRTNKLGIIESVELFYRALRLTILVFVVYIGSFFLVYVVKKDFFILDFIIKEEMLFFILLWVYYTIKMIWLKSILNKEECWSILNGTDGVIGYESKEHVYYDEKKIKDIVQKNIHPLIRILLISDNKLLLKKNESSDKWDIPISGHMLYGETYKECITRLLKKNYNIDEDKIQYLLKYTHENQYELQRVFLHYLLVNSIILQDLDLGGKTKLWTSAQMQEELDSNIFSDKLKKEIILLKELSFPYLVDKK